MLNRTVAPLYFTDVCKESLQLHTNKVVRNRGKVCDQYWQEGEQLDFIGVCNESAIDLHGRLA